MICSVISAGNLVNNNENRKTVRFFDSRREAAMNYIRLKFTNY